MRRKKLLRIDRRGTSRKKKLLIRAAFLLCAAVFVFSAGKLIAYGIRSRKTARLNEELSELYQPVEEISVETEAAVSTEITPEPTEKPHLLAEYQYIAPEVCEAGRELYARNNDLVAWLKISGMVNLPVVYRDNEYYLTHDFDGNESSAGTLFLDVNHPLSSDTQYLLIHGHAMYDGSMFGMVSHYRLEGFVKEHPYLTLNTLYSNDTYEIIASLYVEESEMASVAGMGRSSFSSVEEFDAFLANLKEHAIYFTEEELTPDTALLALSTCYHDGRVVAVFKRLRSTPL